MMPTQMQACYQHREQEHSGQERLERAVPEQEPCPQGGEQSYQGGGTLNSTAWSRTQREQPAHSHPTHPESSL